MGWRRLKGRKKSRGATNCCRECLGGKAGLSRCARQQFPARCAPVRAALNLSCAGLAQSEALRFRLLRYTSFAMSVSRRCFGPGQLQFITSSVYRRLKLFDSYRLRRLFVEVLRECRQEAGFLLAGWRRRAVFWHVCDPPIPRDAYMPTKTVGTYAPPAAGS